MKSLHSPLEIEPPCPDMCSLEMMDVEKRFVRVDPQAAQPPGHKGAGIDIDAVGMKFHIHDRVMPVYDNLSESFFAIEKFVPDPEQIFVRLL